MAISITNFPPKAALVVPSVRPTRQQVNLPNSTTDRALRQSEAESFTSAPETGDRRKSRKLQLLKRCGFFGENTLGVTIERASSLEDLREAYRLVHDVYAEKGYIASNSSGLRLRIFEASPETMTFVAKVDGRIVGVLSLVGNSPTFGLPSDLAFHDEIEEVREPGLKLCEVTNQAVLEEYRKTAVPTELMRAVMGYALVAGYDRSIATVSPGHGCFYQLLGFEQLGTERSYSDYIYDPVVALKLDLSVYRNEPDPSDEAASFVYRFMAGANPYMKGAASASAEARRRFLTESLLRRLFVSEGAFISNCTGDELNEIESLWGSRLFSAVTGRTFWAAARNWAQASLGIMHLVDDVRLSFSPPSPAR